MNFIGWLAMAWLALGAVMVLGGAVRRWRARGGARRYCPGPKRRWRATLIDARHWLRRTPCGYDLSHAPALTFGGVHCPECGTLHGRPQRNLLGSAGRWRLTRLGVLILLTGVPFYRAREPLGRLAISRAPNGVLLGIEAVLGADTPRDVRTAVRRRAERSELTAEEMNRLLPALVRDLRHDDVRGNAKLARELLDRYGVAAFPALREALRSDDHQQRHLALQALWAMDAEPTSQTLCVTVEALRDDLWMGRYAVDNAGSAVRYLLRNPGTSDEFLRQAMRGDDPQQRLLAAAVAGFTQRLDLSDEAVPILVSHLRENLITGDALYALVALHRFGASIRSLLETALESEQDGQGRRSLAFVMFHLLPEEERANLTAPPTPELTRALPNPLLLKPEELRIPSF